MGLDRYAAIVSTFKPVLDAGVAYADGDQLGIVNEIESAQDTEGTSFISDICVIDREANAPDFDIFFFDYEPTLSVANNAAFVLADAEMEKCLGVVSFASTDFVPGGGQSVASKTGIGMMLVSPTKSTKVYAVCVARSIETWAVATSLVIRVKMYQD